MSRFYVPCCYGSIYERRGCTCRPRTKKERAAEERVQKQKAAAERAKKSCGHFRTYWCAVYSDAGAQSVRYCHDCRAAVETRQGLAYANLDKLARARGEHT